MHLLLFPLRKVSCNLSKNTAETSSWAGFVSSCYRIPVRTSSTKVSGNRILTAQKQNSISVGVKRNGQTEWQGCTEAVVLPDLGPKQQRQMRVCFLHVCPYEANISTCPLQKKSQPRSSFYKLEVHLFILIFTIRLVGLFCFPFFFVLSKKWFILSCRGFSPIFNLQIL